MHDVLWTFNPVYPEIYSTQSPKVIVVGAEPNEKGLRPDRDMGLWFRTASANNFWGNSIFYQATLRQVRAVLPADIAGQADDAVLTHVRYVDLKAAGGGGKARKDQVAKWARDHLHQVAGYWLNDRPTYTIIQGVHAQEVFEEIVAPALCARNIECQKVGLLHPSRQNQNHLSNPAYLEALKQVSEKLRQLDEPLVQWDPWNKQWWQMPHAKAKRTE